MLSSRGLAIKSSNTRQPHAAVLQKGSAVPCRLPVCLPAATPTAKLPKAVLQPYMERPVQDGEPSTSTLGVDANGARTGYGELDEYESPYDIGFTRDYVEDQAGFITQELDLPEEQQAYLLMKLGLLGNNSESEESAGEEAQEELPTDDDELQELLDAAAQEEQEMEQAEEEEAAVSYSLIEPEELQAAPQATGRDVTSGVTSSSIDFSVSIAPNLGLGFASTTYQQEGALQAAAEAPVPQSQLELEAPPSNAESVSLAMPQQKEQQEPRRKGVPRVPYDPQIFEHSYDIISLRVIGRRNSTAAAMGEEIELTPGRIIAGRYQVLEQVGAAAFSRAVQVLDLKDDTLLCLKVVKNDKESLDACLEEIRLLALVNARDPEDEHGLIRMHDYFYYLGHLFIVMELLGGNLYETQRQDPNYFTLPRVQYIAKQSLQSLAFLHAQDIIHADIKPENILVKDYKKCMVKVIDLGCSIYHHETRNSHYVQSRSYRAPEVMLGLPYDGRIDVWSLGCVLAELITGQVLFPAVADVAVEDEVFTEQITEAAMLARMAGMLGGFPDWMLMEGSFAGAFFTRGGVVYERCTESGYFQVLTPKRTNLAARVPGADAPMLHFLSQLLHPDPAKRPTVEQALRHPWLSHKYRTT